MLGLPPWRVSRCSARGLQPGPRVLGTAKEVLGLQDFLGFQDLDFIRFGFDLALALDLDLDWLWI